MLAQEFRGTQIPVSLPKVWGVCGVLSFKCAHPRALRSHKRAEGLPSGLVRTGKQGCRQAQVRLGGRGGSASLGVDNRQSSRPASRWGWGRDALPCHPCYPEPHIAFLWTGDVQSWTRQRGAGHVERRVGCWCHCNTQHPVTIEEV